MSEISDLPMQYGLLPGESACARAGGARVPCPGAFGGAFGGNRLEWQCESGMAPDLETMIMAKKAKKTKSSKAKKNAGKKGSKKGGSGT